MVREVEPAKPKIGHLKILERLIEDRMGVSAANHTGGSSTYSMFYRDPLKGDPSSYDWFKAEITQPSSVVHMMYRWGWLNVFKKPKWDDKTSSSGIFAWYEHPQIPTRQAAEYWEETGKALLAELRAEEAAARAEVERYAIIGAKSKQTRDRADRRAGMLVRIVRETPKRFYVEVVDHADQAISKWYMVEGDTRKGQYIGRDQVWMDNVTRAQYARIVEAENMIVAEKKSLRAERDHAIKEIRDRFAERELQQNAEHEDRLKGI